MRVLTEMLRISCFVRDYFVRDEYQEISIPHSPPARHCAYRQISRRIPRRVSFVKALMTHREFQRTIWRHHRLHVRDLPWRLPASRQGNPNPYQILVSEIMLQQTQVDRVVPKYTEFIRAFPTIRSLAHAPLKDVLRVWQGLGYNRRAKMLQETAKEIVKNHGGRIPKNPETLQSLPGIGPYTARAICVFAYNIPSVCIETNIRSVYLHFFFKERSNVSDTELIPLIEKTLSYENPREWYAALMDYGSVLKKENQNPSRKSTHHVRQAPFKGSTREIRGAIVKVLVKNTRVTMSDIVHSLASFEKREISAQIDRLCEEGLVRKRGGTLHIA